MADSWETPPLIHRVGKEIGVDPKVILETSHGRRSMDMLKILAPEKANWECKSGHQFPLFSTTPPFHPGLIFKFTSIVSFLD